MQFNRKFPESYASCLLRYGISSFHREVVFPVKRDNSENDHPHGYAANVSVFYGIDPLRDERSIERQIERARYDHLPHHFLPILDADDRDVVYISLEDNGYGRVVMLTREMIWDVMNGELAPSKVEDAAFHIANSFEGFVELLYARKEEHLPPQIPFTYRADPIDAAFNTRDISFFQQMADAGELLSWRRADVLPLLQIAVYKGAVWAVEFLLDHGVPIHGGLTWAAYASQVETMRFLVERGANVNEKVEFSQFPHGDPTLFSAWLRETPLIAAVCSQNKIKKYDAAQFLIEKGADVSLRDRNGKTAIDYVHPRNQKMRGILTKQS
jgi:hypothetical protein